MPKSSDEEFDSWNQLKKKIDEKDSVSEGFPKKGEVWMIALGKNIGFEQNGAGNNFSRPMLIVKKFNNHMFWAISLSTKQKSLDFYHNFTDPNGKKVSAVLAQMKLISVKGLQRKLYEFDAKEYTTIRGRLQRFFD